MKKKKSRISNGTGNGNDNNGKRNCICRRCI